VLLNFVNKIVLIESYAEENKLLNIILINDLLGLRVSRKL